MSAHVVNNRLSVAILIQLFRISKNSFLFTPLFVKSTFFDVVKSIHTNVNTNGLFYENNCQKLKYKPNVFMIIIIMTIIITVGNKTSVLVANIFGPKLFFFFFF